LEYYFRRAIDTIMASPVISGVTLAAICVSILFSGTVLLVSSNAYRLVARTAVAGSEASIYLVQEVTDEQIAAVRAQLERDPAVVDIRFVSAEEAWQFLVDSLVDDASLLDGLDASVLPASLELKLRQGLTAQALGTRASVWSGLSGVADVQHTRLGEPGAPGAIDVVRWVAWALGALALLASVLMVTVTFQLAAHARREELDVLRVMGAVGRQFWGPVVLGGLLEGILGAFVGVLLLAGAFLGFESIISSRASLGDFRAAFLLPGQCLVLVGWGAMLGACGSAVGVWRVGHWR
jgi:cell division transport system permease protein